MKVKELIKAQKEQSDELKMLLDYIEGLGEPARSLALGFWKEVFESCQETNRMLNEFVEGIDDPSVA